MPTLWSAGVLGLALTIGSAFAADSTYYLVEGALERPDGRRVGTSISLVRRTVDRDAGRIDEVVLSLRGKDPARELVTVIRPEGDHAKLSSEGEFAGEATLTGPAWAWTGMRFTTKSDKAGVQVDGEDTFSADAFTATKKVMGADGKLQIVIRETGKSISEPVYQLLRSRLLLP